MPITAIHSLKINDAFLDLINTVPPSVKREVTVNLTPRQKYVILRVNSYVSNEEKGIQKNAVFTFGEDREITEKIADVKGVQGQLGLRY